ncbi:hypothetical protein [Actinoplanes derwentensis]|uniref:Leucine rich repeat variant n=1 Tax=Actinoplanes derwentensis TaxID=113562 RepID=A0A1H1QST5_9ACTN|nr:hypothetical protein [Actinoplanes derwentensis]GID89340.1 hypothetical protein Ade03nite_82640 [Actinoplanes derwentensis]SDS26530.1 hypothetical protein SAMN04489716_0390 [Actinoplanes derwentensis]
MCGLARNPALPAGTLLRLATAGVLDRWELTARDVWDDEAFDALATHPDPALREALAQSPGATGEQRARLVGDLSIRVLHAVLEGPPARWSDRLPDWAYRRLATHPEPGVRDMLTFLPGVPRAVITLLTGDPQPGIAAAARALLDRRKPGSETLGRARAAEFAAGATPWDRARAAADPDLPAEWVTALAADPSPQVRLAVSMRPGLTEPQRAAIDHPMPEQTPILDWVLAAGHTELRECALSGHAGLRRSAACHPDLPDDLVVVLADDDDATVRLLLCEHQADLPGELLVRVHLSAGDDDLLRHPAFPRTDLAGLAASPDPRARALTRLDPAVPASLIERLSHDPDESVRVAVAGDGRLPVPRLLQLFDDPPTTGAASANPRLPRRVIDRILADIGLD